jgi:CheY-like chemotaxis protein
MVLFRRRQDDGVDDVDPAVSRQNVGGHKPGIVEVALVVPHRNLRGCAVEGGYERHGGHVAGIEPLTRDVVEQNALQLVRVGKQIVEGGLAQVGEGGVRGGKGDEGPGPLSVSARPAATSVLNWPADTAVSTGSLEGGNRTASKGELILQTRAGQAPVILVADDNEMTATMWRDVLRGSGARVIIAVNGREALAQTNLVRPGASLMDMQMPEMDGRAALCQLRAAGGALARIQVMALTALARLEDRERCLAAGADAYLSKPVKLDELLQLLACLLAQGRTQDEA